MNRPSLFAESHADRQKVDVRLPQALNATIGTLADALGIPKNAFFALAVAQFAVGLLALEPAKKKRGELLRALGAQFDAVLQEAKNIK